MSHDTIEKLQERYTKFHNQQIRVQAQLEEAQKRLGELQLQAKKEFGTDDVNSLQQQLESMKKDNEKKQSEYQKCLDEVESKLKSVEAEFAEATVED
jgi:predicted  nucleic acid-binding Zn-ribbon protein